MSHYAVLVITNEEPTNELLAATLQPFHEFECTGIDDQYVVDVDVTEEVEEGFAKYTYTRWLDAAGVKHSPYEDQFYREPVDADGLGERSHGHGGNGKISWASKDWEDGKGYRTKVHLTAAEVGMTEIKVPAAEVETMAEWAEEYGGWVQRSDGRFYKHANPNAQWDWYQLGGRYGGKLRTLVKSATDRRGRAGVADSTLDLDGVDIAQRKNLNFQTMKASRVNDRREWIADIKAKSGVTSEELDTALRAKAPLHEAWLKLDHRPRGDEYNAWMRTQGEAGVLLDKVSTACWDVPDIGSCSTAEEWVNAAPAFTCWSVLQNGQWTEKGKMGWWGMSDDNMTEEEWAAKVSELVETMDPDHWLAIVDCHI